MAKSNDRAQVEKYSPFAFRETLDLLSKAITDAGLTLFAVIDHAQNAAEAGLQMPPTTVLIYGKAEGGTPIMLEHPQSALDLPLRALVREDADGKTILSLYPIAKARFDPCPIDQSFPGGDEDKRQRRRLAHREIGGLVGEQPCVDRSIFGKRALNPAHAACHAINFVARLEVVHARANAVDDAGNIDPEDSWQGMARMRCCTGADLEIQRIDAAGLDPHQNLPRPCDGARDLDDREGGIVGFQHGSAH